MRSQNASTDVVSGGGSGAVCQASGPYKCNGHTEVVVVFKRGDRFPPCPMNGGHSTTWSIVREPPADR
jgi:hypothetical protein